MPALTWRYSFELAEVKYGSDRPDNKSGSLHHSRSTDLANAAGKRGGLESRRVHWSQRRTRRPPGIDVHIQIYQSPFKPSKQQADIIASHMLARFPTWGPGPPSLNLWREFFLAHLPSSYAEAQV